MSKSKLHLDYYQLLDPNLLHTKMILNISGKDVFSDKNYSFIGQLVQNF